MKILVVCQHYWPEPYYLHEVCEELVKRGHTVHVVTDVPNYPMGEIYDDYKHGKRREEEKDGVRITRTFTIGRRHNILFRILNYYSYSLSSTAYVNKLPGDYDVVFTNQTSPIMMTRAATAYSKRWGKKCIMYCLDLWPASLAAGGLNESNLIYKFFGKVSKKLYKRADRILISSLLFRDYLIKEHGIENNKIEYLPNYAYVNFDSIPEIKEKETMDFVFAGNIGAAQSLNTLLDAAKELKKRELRGKKIIWHIVGDGSELDNLKTMANRLELDNVIFHGRHPANEMPKFYAMADAMLVFLTSDKNISRTLPSKVQTYMSAGKPILAAANGEIPQIIEQAKCGYSSPAEDGYAFANTVERFINSPDKEQFGINAKSYYDQHFKKELFMDKLEQELLNECQQ